MASLYITRDTVDINLSNGHVVVTDRNTGTQSSVRLSTLDRVIVVGNPGITFPALLALSDEGIPAFFITQRGRWRASLLPDNNRNAERRIRQYVRAGGDTAFELRASKASVRSKLRNARRTLQRLASNRHDTDSPLYRSVQIDMDAAISAVEGEDSLDAVRGYEGEASARYFELLGTYFPETMPFPRRSRRPPKDAANALLSFSYTLLLGEVECCVRSHGLDACIGNLHRDLTGAPSLALDLMEPFRPALCDRFVLDLAGHGTVRSDEHFEERDDGVFLNDVGRKVFFPAWDAVMNRPFEGSDGMRTDFRKEIDRTVCTYLKALEEDADPDYFHLA